MSTHRGRIVPFVPPVLFVLSVLSVPFAARARGEVRLPNIFGDHMVVQRDKPVRVWGWAKPGEKVTVRSAGQSKPARADAKGEWSVTLEPMEASSAGRELVVEAPSGKVVLADVLVGEVWLCGGQSNMEYSLRATRDADVEVPSANSPGVRFLRLPHIARLEPQTDFPVADPQRGKIILRFEEGTNRGLVLARDDECGFYVAGSDREFHHARARVVKDNKLMVWSEEVAEPVAVRYAWSNLPAGALMNRRELPAYPFRTDTWPLVPHQSTGAYEANKK